MRLPRFRFLFLLLAVLTPFACGFAGDNPAAVKTPVAVWIESKHDLPEYNGAVGDVWVKYQDGTTDRWTTRGNCAEPQLGPGGLVAWLVGNLREDGGLYLYKDEIPVLSTLRIFRKGKVIATISAGPFIEDFRFEPDGKHVVLKSRAAHGPAWIRRCETEGGKTVAESKAYAPEGETLPAWTKGFED